ncbi:MAG: hypothetical protein IJN20_08025 [Oscillospiraceae bacterium]|nr:hypothetical protein [Oscillospiraceae bacterium]
MKRMLSMLLALLLCLGCAGCSSPDNGTEITGQTSHAEQTGDLQMYVPGTTIITDFGSVTVMDAAFCTKAQIYYTVSSRTAKTTVNGQTTETHEELIHPGYLTSMDNKLVFALKTVITNTTAEDMEIHKLQVAASFAEGAPVYFSKGGNFHISDEAYKVLPAGGSSEIVLAALVPVDQYAAASECLLEVGGAQLGFSYDSINIYNALGFQEGDNTAVSIDEVIQGIDGGAEHTSISTVEETEPLETELVIDRFPGVYKKNGSSVAEGRAMIVQDVTVGFSDILPNVITSSSSYSYNSDQYAINDSQTYAVIRFNLTNLTEEEMKIVDHKDNFMLQMTYDGRYKYSTNNDTYNFLTTGAQYGMVKKNSTFTSSGGMTVAPLASAEVTAYIPCAKKVAENPDKALSVTFISKHNGNESFTFNFENRTAAALEQLAETVPVESAPAAEAAAVISADADYASPYVETGYNLTAAKAEVYDCRMYTQDNGITRFEVDYKTSAGNKVVVFAHVGKDENPAYLYEPTELTTGEKETLVFEMETDLLNKSYGPDIHFRNEDGDVLSWVLIYHTQEYMKLTNGNPTGDAKSIKTSKDGKAKVHGATMQPLDNGYVRFAIDCTPPADRKISVFNPPEGSEFMYFSRETTSGERMMLELDIKQKDIKKLSTITIKFWQDGSNDGDFIFLKGSFKAK